MLDDVERVSVALRAAWWAQARTQIDALILSYFDVTDAEAFLVNAARSVYIPSVQPATYEAISTVASGRPTPGIVEHYAAALQAELERWRDARGGSGMPHVEAFIEQSGLQGACGIVRLSIGRKSRDAVVAVTDAPLAAQALWQPFAEDLGARAYLRGDVVVRRGDEILLVKPLLQRLWHPARALDDARRVAELAAH